MKRILPLLLVLPLCATGYACTHKSSTDDGSSGSSGNPGDNGQPGSSSGNNGSSGTNADLNKNPIDGIQPVAIVLDTGEYTDGPVWDVNQGVLFFTTPLGVGGLYRMREDGSTLQLRVGDPVAGSIPIGNAIDQTGTLVTFEAKRVERGGESAEAGAPQPIVTGYPSEGGVAPFDTLKSGVVRKDGTLYMTDPGYFGTPIANRIFRVGTDGTVTVVEAFEDVPRPNGIALSPDQKTLYVGFTQPGVGTIPFLRKYIVNDDGTLGEHAKFVDVAPEDSSPDGIEVDQGGNVYVANKAGISVFKADGTKIGDIAVPDQPTGVAFGGKDLTTLYITTQGTKIYSVTVNVPGIAQ